MPDADRGALFARVFEHARDMIFILDPSRGRIVDANPMAVRTLGYSRAELLALSPADLHPTSMVRFEQFVTNVLEMGSGWTDESECVTKAGELIPAEIAASRIDLGGRPHLLAIARDVTERRRADRELQLLSCRVVEAQESERRRIAGELHDGVSQILSSARFRVQGVAHRLEDAAPEVRHQATAAVELLERAMSEVRLIIRALRPPELDDLGLNAALRGLGEEFRRRAGLAVNLNVRKETGHLPSEIELALYRIAQEALTNVERHAAAKAVTLSLRTTRRAVVMTIIDDGRGMDWDQPEPGSEAGGVGLAVMRERASTFGGTVRIGPRSASGTKVTACIPFAGSIR